MNTITIFERGMLELEELLTSWCKATIKYTVVVPRKLLKSVKDVPCPQRPSLVMYPILRGSEAPVAEQYTTRASGSLAC